MGFFDSIKGFGTSVFETLGRGVEAVLPSFIEAGATALFQNIFPQQRPAGSQVFAQRRPVLGPTAPLLLPPSARRQPPLLTPGGVRQTFTPQGRTISVGGSPMPHFPGDQFGVTQASFAVPALGGNGLTDFFDIPGIDLRSPFTADARTGGNAFFHGVGAVRQRPRSLIMQMNPSTGTPTFFRHAGRPIMFSGDRAICKGVEKIARRHARPRSRR